MAISGRSVYSWKADSMTAVGVSAIPGSKRSKRCDQSTVTAIFVQARLTGIHDQKVLLLLVIDMPDPGE
jgi:hypothetical protein